ncbi:MAG: bifunctional riboflavin kinase/FAD synthetase [Bacteroidota bacterium]
MNPNSCVTVGTYDGVHIAHQEILRKLVAAARRRNGRSVVLTFDPHPREVLSKKNEPFEILTTLSERMDLFKEFGIDIAVVVKFDEEFARQSFEDFYKKYIIDGIGAAEVYEGPDHRFGRDREGDIETLKMLGMQYHFSVHLLEPVAVNGLLVGSSRLRSILHLGEVDAASKLLGRPYAISGIVVEGDKRGHALGYPTANLLPDSARKLIPADGIYLTKAVIGSRLFYGLTSIGVRPTFYTAGKRLVETHILNFDENLYGASMTVRMLQRLRDEMKFYNVNDLIEQMNRDKKKSQELIKELETETHV